MPKKTTILIIILAVIVAILIFLAVRTDQTQTTNKGTQVNTTPTTIQQKPYATLSFAPSFIDTSNSTITQKVDIFLDSKGGPVSGAQIELSYDPKALANVTLSPPTTNPFFSENPVVLINSVDPTQGRISYAVGVAPNGKEKVGSGNIVTLTFTVNRFAGVASSQITFLPKSTVKNLSSQGSVLSASSPLQIIVSPATTGSSAATISPTY